MNENNLWIDEISKTYKKGKVKANDNISLELYPAEITALIGHNGAGKTTLLNQIIGNVKPSRGDIMYKGVSLVKNPKAAREIVSMMPQFRLPLTGVTLRQSIESVLRIKGISEKQVRLCTEQIINELDIGQWADRAGNKLSGGLQRLTSFAMAVAYPSEIILLDEPTNDVDPIRRKLIWQYMRRLAKEGHIIFVVTHNLLEVEQYTDRYILLNKGRLIRNAPTTFRSSDLVSNVLTVALYDAEKLYDLPEAETCEYKKDEMQFVLTLSKSQIANAVNWLMKLIEQGKVLNYKLTSATLDMQYGGMVDEE